MKALRVILAAGALTAIAGSALAADEQVVKESGSTFPSYLDPVSVRAEVGTTGYGGAISYRVNPYVGLTLVIMVVIFHGLMMSKLMVPNMILIWRITTHI
jgi:hypothetical protein